MHAVALCALTNRNPWQDFWRSHAPRGASFKTISRRVCLYILLGRTRRRGASKYYYPQIAWSGRRSWIKLRRTATLLDPDNNVNQDLSRKRSLDPRMDEAAAEVALGCKRSSTSEYNPRGVPARSASPPGTAAETEGVGTDAATEQTLEQTLAAKSEDAIQQKAGLPAASIGCTFEFAGRRFLRTGPRTAKCLAPDCPTKGGQQFGLHSYGNMQIAQHAGECIRNNGAKVRAGASKLARAENKAEAHQDAEASWILGDRQLPQNRSVVGVCLLPSRSWVLTAVSTPHFGSCSNSSSSAKPPIYSLPR